MIQDLVDEVLNEISENPIDVDSHYMQVISWIERHAEKGGLAYTTDKARTRIRFVKIAALAIQGMRKCDE